MILKREYVFQICYHNKLIFTLDKPGYFFIAKNVQKFVVFIELLYPKSKFVLTNRKNKIQTYFVFQTVSFTIIISNINLSNRFVVHDCHLKPLNSFFLHRNTILGERL